MNSKAHTHVFLVPALIALALMASIAGASETYRTFSDLQGRTFDGQVMAFNAATGVVTIKRADGKIGKMSLDAFSEADRLHIRDWSATDAFMNGLKLTVLLQTREISSKDAGFSDVTKMVFDSEYGIQLENRSLSALGKIDLEYCIFYRQGTRTRNIVNYDEGICFGKDRIASLEPAAKDSRQTKSVRLYSEGGNQTMFGQVSVSDANVRGIWVRLKTFLPSGKELVREYRSADDEKWKWTPRSIGVGLNKSDSSYSMYLVK